MYVFAIRGFLMIAIVLSSVDAYSTDLDNASKPVAGVADLQIKKDEIAQVTIEALHGSGDAALRLSLFYGAVKLEYAEKLYWARIGAENGNATAMYSYGFYLMQYGESDEKSGKPTTNDKIRGRFWIDKAAAAGNDAAKKYIAAHPDK